MATLFRGFAEGMGGKAPVGGLVVGRDGVGIEAIAGYRDRKRATRFGRQGGKTYGARCTWKCEDMC